MGTLINAREHLSETRRPDRLTPLELDQIVWDMINKETYPKISHDEFREYVITAADLGPFPRWLMQKAMMRDPSPIDGQTLDRLVDLDLRSIFWLYHTFLPQVVCSFRHRYVLESNRQWAQLRSGLRAAVGRDLAGYLEAAL